MDKFDIHELLRYLVTGMFFCGLNYLAIDPTYLSSGPLGGDKASAVLLGLSLVSGAIIYVTYRSVVYPLLNMGVCKLTNTYRKREIPVFASCNVVTIIRKTDFRRWRVQNSEVLKKLYEWASQVHFLYTLALSCLIVLLLKQCFPGVYTQSLKVLAAGFFFLLFAVLHHVRYKKYEVEVVKQVPDIEYEITSSSALHV